MQLDGGTVLELWIQHELTHEAASWVSTVLGGRTGVMVMVIPVVWLTVCLSAENNGGPSLRYYSQET